jgi:hypothetical protein
VGVMRKRNAQARRGGLLSVFGRRGCDDEATARRPDATAATGATANQAGSAGEGAADVRAQTADDWASRIVTPRELGWTGHGRSVGAVAGSRQGVVVGGWPDSPRTAARLNGHPFPTDRSVQDASAGDELDLAADPLVPFGVALDPARHPADATGDPGPATDPAAAEQPAAPARRSPAAPVPAQLGAPRAADRGELIVLPGWEQLPSMEVRVDLTGVERRRARQATRKALDWHGRFVIVHTGNIGIRQGLEELAGAVRRLAEAQPDVLVSFIGNGNRRQALARATAGLPNVEIRDAVPPDQLFAVLLASDLLLVSERSDGQDVIVPSKLTSYFAAARPVIAVVSEGSATALEVARSGAGVLVDPGDPLGFGAQVAALRGDPAERARLGDAGLRFVANEALSRLG